MRARSDWANKSILEKEQEKNMAIKWDPEIMSTGSIVIDDQHKEWIRRFNQFEDAVINRHGTEAIYDALQFFMSYTETHFPYEEALMKKYNCPVAELNRAEHDLFRHKLLALEKRVRSEGVSLVEVIELKVDMEQWLFNHICKVDAELCSVINPSD